jgi:hypothetical protein
MSLLKELQERRTHVLEELNRVEELRAELADIDRAIAAIEPEAVADEWHDDFLALTDEQPELFDEPQEIEAPAQPVHPEAELRSVPGTEEESRDQFEEEAERAAAIELTADVEPLPEPLEPMHFEVLPEPVWNEPQPIEGYAPVVDHTEAHIQAVEAERYAQPTNPEADFWARGLASDQKPQSRFNIFRHKREDA